MHMDIMSGPGYMGGMSMFGGLSILFILIYLFFLGLGLYTIYLVIKALKIYIRKNDDRQDRDDY